jgi:hypothetical protein
MKGSSLGRLAVGVSFLPFGAYALASPFRCSRWYSYLKSQLFRKSSTGKVIRCNEISLLTWFMVCVIWWL